MNRETVVTAFLLFGRGAEMGTLTNWRHAFQGERSGFAWTQADPKV